ncbi:MAG: flagellar biosynthetic protein FliO, partial [Acetobacteraceae bacterium]
MIPDLATVATAVAALAVVLALVLFVARLARFGGIQSRAAGNRLLIIEETIALDPRRRLHLVRCAGRRVLVLTGGGSDTVVGWLPGQE